MEASLRIFSYIILCTTVVLSLSSRREEQWVCEAGEKYCVYKASRHRNWNDASERCIALGGMLPYWMIFKDTPQLFTDDEINAMMKSTDDEINATLWSSLYWYAGRWHGYREDLYSDTYLGYLEVNDAVLRHIAKGENCFAIGNWSSGLSWTSSPFKARFHKCNIVLPFVCITEQAKFNETQGKLRLPLKQVIDIEFQKIAGGDPGTEVLRCVPKFRDAYDNLKDRPFNIVWILDDAYYPEEGIKHGDHSKTITVPQKHFTKYACEVRYLGSIYGNRSQEIEVATPLKNKLGLLIRVRNATFSTSSLDYARPIKELVRATNMDKGNFSLSLAGDSLFEQDDSELIIATYMLVNENSTIVTDRGRYTERVELNTERELPFQANTLEAIKFFENLIRNGTLVGGKFFAVDLCPLESSASFFWASGVGAEVQPSLTGTGPSEICLDEYDFPVTRTCSGGSLVSGAQWVENFAEEKNCSRPSNKSTGTFCHAGYSLTTLAEEKGVYCVKQVPSRTWNDAMEACFGADALSLSELSILGQYDTTSWIRSTIDYLTRGDTSGSLMENLLWLPSRRRVPGGPLYPFMMPSIIVKQPYNYSESNDWEVSFSSNSDSANKSLSYGDLDDSECLAWSVKAGTLTTRSCSEIHPTVCIGRGYPVGSRKAADFPKLVSLYIPECSEFDSIVVDAFGLNSCQKLIRGLTLNGSVSADFTWEEARMQCETLHKNATLAIPALSENTANIDYVNASVTQPTWFGIRRSGGRSNPSCRLVTSTNQCAGPIHGFSSDTDFLYGVYASSSGNGQDSLTLRLPETRLSQAICEVNVKLAPSVEIPVSYHLKLAWKNSTGNTLKLFLTQEGKLLRGHDWEKILERDWLLILWDWFALEMVSCLTRTLAEFTFVVTGRDRRFRIVPENELRATANVTLITKSDFAVLFEPSKISNKNLRQSRSINIELGNDSSPSKIRKYTVLNRKYERVAVESKNYEELLLRYHVVFNSMSDNLTAAFMQLRGDMGSLMEKIDSPYRRFRPYLKTLRSMVTCLEELEERSQGHLTWIETPLDRTTFSREGCVFEGGSLVQRTCIGDIYYGAYWGPTQAWNAAGQLVNLSIKFACARSSEITSQLLNMTETQQNATSALAELQQVTSEWKPIVADVQLTALIFSNASKEETEFSQMNVNQTATIIQQVLNVDAKTLANAQRLPNVTTNLLMGIEEILTSTNANKSTLMAPSLRGISAELTGSSPFVFTANSSNLGESDDTVANIRIIRRTSPAVTDNLHHDALVIFNGSSLMVNRINASQIAFVYQTNIRLADAAVAARETFANVYSPNPSDGDHDMLLTAKHTTNSAMVQVAVGGGPVYNLSESVHIYFRPFGAVNTSTSSNSVVCAFWNPKVNHDHGGWSTEGCSYLGNVGDLNHCQCNHLSSFTSFFPYENYKPSSHDPILDALTKIGCAFSLLGCTGVIATYTLFPKWRKPKPGYYGHHVIFQLSLALALLLSTFLGGFDRTSTDDVCLFVAVFLHYLMLVVFFWMLVEAYCHYLLFVRVMGSFTSYFMLKASLFAWVLPLIPVVALVVCDREFYYYTDKKNFCWLTTLGFYYALLPFASLIGLINLALYIIIIVKVGFAKPTIRSTQSKRPFTPYTAIVIFFVMGLSWIFGLLAIGHARIFFSYLFCMFNSLQGSAIFIHFILRGEKAREYWQKFMQWKSDRANERASILGKPKHYKTSLTSIVGATSHVSLSTSISSIHSQVIGELKTRQRLQKRSEYETSNL